MNATRVIKVPLAGDITYSLMSWVERLVGWKPKLVHLLFVDSSDFWHEGPRQLPVGQKVWI